MSALDIKIVTVPIARIHWAARRGIIQAARQAAPVAQMTNGVQPTANSRGVQCQTF